MLAYGTVVHVVQLVAGWLTPYDWAPAWMAAYFTALTVADPLAAPGAPGSSPQSKLRQRLVAAQRHGVVGLTWPLPGPGVGFTCEWPAYGMRETKVELEGQLLTDAAARSIQLWPEEWLA